MADEAVSNILKWPDTALSQLSRASRRRAWRRYDRTWSVRWKRLAVFSAAIAATTAVNIRMAPWLFERGVNPPDLLWQQWSAVMVLGMVCALGLWIGEKIARVWTADEMWAAIDRAVVRACPHCGYTIGGMTHFARCPQCAQELPEPR